MKKTIKKKEILILIIIFIFIMIGFYLLTYIRVNHTNSEPIGFYYLSKVDEVKKGDKVIIKQDRFIIKGLEDERKKDILKTIQGVAGDKVTVKNNYIYVNGENFGKILEIDEINPFFKEGDEIVIPDGKYLLLGRSLLSYDSRYLGFFEKNEFENKAKLLYEINKGEFEIREKNILKMLKMKDLLIEINEKIAVSKFQKDFKKIGFKKIKSFK